MYRHELEQSDKSIGQRVSTAVAGLIPRKATVTRSDGSGVWVRFDIEGSTAPESHFPSTVAGLPAGSTGWVIRLGGAKGLFVATGVPQVHSIESYRNGADPVSTTSLDPANPYWWDGDATGIVRVVTLTPGLWEFDIYASMKIRRSVATGGVWLVVTVDGQQANTLDYQTTSMNVFFSNFDTRRFTVNVTSTRNINIRLGFAGRQTAGTTFGYHPLLTGTYKMIGAPQ